MKDEFRTAIRLAVARARPITYAFGDCPVALERPEWGRNRAIHWEAETEISQQLQCPSISQRVRHHLVIYNKTEKSRLIVSGVAMRGSSADRGEQEFPQSTCRMEIRIERVMCHARRALEKFAPFRDGCRRLTRRLS